MLKSIDKSSVQFWTYLFLVCAAAILLYPVIFANEYSFFIKQDNLHQAYPAMNKLAIALHKGYLPVWDANTYGGKNFSGDLIPGIFYPLNVIWCLLFGTAKGIDTYYLDLLVALHYLICLLGMYKLARVFQLPTVAAIASALIFTFTSAVGARAAGQTCIFYGLALLPWAIYFITKYYLERRYKIYLVFSGLIAGLEILAGHMQPFFHTILIGGIIILFYEYLGRKDWKSFFLSTVVNVSIVLLFAILIALPQIYYASEYMSRCYRTVSGGVFIGPGQKVPLFIYAHWFIIELSNLGNFFGQKYAQPNDDNILYMGILPLFLVVVYLVYYWSRPKKANSVHATFTKLLTMILVIGVLSSLGYVTLFYLVLYNIPFVNLVRQLGRYIILISFSASLLTGLAITHAPALKEWLFQSRLKIRFYGLCALIILSFLWVLIAQNYIPPAVSFPFLLAFLFFLILPTIKRPQYLPIIAVAVIFIDLLLNPVAYLPTRTGFYPDYFYGRNRIIDSLEATYGKYRVMFDMNNYSLVRRNLGDIYSIQTKWGYGATVNMPYASFTDMNQTSNPEVNDLLNIRYVITDKKLDSNFIYKDSAQQVRLYERENWYPRCYWKRQLGQKGEKIEKENEATIQQLAYSDLYEKIAVECLTSDTLIFSENYYPGWECYDNGKRIAIYRATIKNYPPLFRSIVLDKGRHLIEFKYKKAFYWF